MERLVRYEAEIGSGVWADLKNRAAPFWVSGKNVIFRDAGIMPVSGQTLAFPRQQNVPVRGMIANDNSATYKLFYGTSDSLWGWDGNATVTDLSKTGGYTAPDDWVFANFGAWTLATDGDEKVQIRKTGDFADLGGVTFDWAKLIEVRTPYVVVINTNLGPNSASWCKRDDVETWLAAADNDAGELTARDMDSAFRASAMLRGEICTLTDSRLMFLTYVGGTNIFGWQPTSVACGALSKNAIVNVPPHLYGVGPRGFWRTDGSSFEYIDSKAVRKKFKDELRWEKRSRVVAWHNVAERSVFWFYCGPHADENDRGLIFSYETGVWSELTFGRSAAENSEVFETGITGSADGGVFLQDQDGAPISSGFGKVKIGEQLTLDSGFGALGFGRGAFGGHWVP